MQLRWFHTPYGYALQVAEEHPNVIDPNVKLDWKDVRVFDHNEVEVHDRIVIVGGSVGKQTAK